VRVAVTQPNYLPWLGYLELLDEVDVWVSLDNVDLTRRSFVVRNRVKLRNGEPTWLSLRVASFPRGTTIREGRLADAAFAERHLRVIRENYRDARWFDEHMGWLEETLPVRDESVARHNERIVQALADRLGISVRFHRASELAPELEGSAQEKILRVIDALDAHGAPSGPRVSAYLNAAGGIEAGLYRAEAFAERGIRLLKQEYRHPSYAQPGQDFLSHLSAVDLLLHTGPAALDILRQGRRWTEVDPGG
jgi:hypothetical protein